MGKIGNFAKRQAKKAIQKQVSKYTQKASDYLILEKTMKILPKEKLVSGLEQNTALVITPIFSDKIIRYIVNDPEDNLRYVAKIKPDESSDDIYLVNAKGEDCAVIKKKAFSLKLTYFVRAGNQTLGYIKQGRKGPKPSYRAKYLGWKVKGNLMATVYKVMENGSLVLTISRHQKSVLALEFAEFSNSNELSGVILAIVVDMIYRDDLRSM